MPRGSDSDELFDIYRALGHPLRRRIIQYLGEHGKASFTELRRNLGVSVGTLYYNLGQLKDYVMQSSDKKYLLTERGRLAYELMKRDSERLNIYGSIRTGRLAPVLNALSPLFFPQWIRWILSNKIALPAVALSVLVFGLVTSAMSGLELSLLFYYTSSSSSTILALKYLLSWISVAALCDAFSWIFHGRRGEHIRLFLAVAVAMIPLAIYPVLHTFFIGSFPLQPQILGIPLRRLVLGSVLVLLQLMTVCHLSLALGQIKGFETERAFIIVSIVYYLNMVFNMIIKQNISLPTVAGC